ncbi:hypothetical protein ACLOJK_028836 [Asimina triloba]
MHILLPTSPALKITRSISVRFKAFEILRYISQLFSAIDPSHGVVLETTLFSFPIPIPIPIPIPFPFPFPFCRQWKLGRCYRLPCPFLHPDIPSADDRPSPSASALDPAKMLLCRFWALGKCRYGNSCRFLHTWNVGDSFSFLTALKGHHKGIRGIALPSGSDKLYSGSKDKSVRVWDCNTGKCAAVVNVGVEVGCMISAGPWIFVGLVNVVKVWNTQTYNEILLGGPVGQVHSLATTGFHPPETSGELLFAGQQDGSILVWKFNSGENSFEPTPSLLGHSSNVVSLTVGGQRLYSSSLDNTIRSGEVNSAVWDIATLQCLETLRGHTSAVTSVLCWDQYLLSASLDQTIKSRFVLQVWASTESGNREVTYTHNAEHGVLFLCGTYDLQAKPVLMSAFYDNSVRLYDIPSFIERGKVLSKDEIRSIQSGPDGLFFTGDDEGVLKRECVVGL